MTDDGRTDGRRTNRTVVRVRLKLRLNAHAQFNIIIFRGRSGVGRATWPNFYFPIIIDFSIDFSIIIDFSIDFPIDFCVIIHFSIDFSIDGTRAARGRKFGQYNSSSLFEARQVALGFKN